MTDRDEYVKVQGKARHVRSAAVLFSPGETMTGAWIPRSVIHGADDLDLTARTAQINSTSHNCGIPMTLRMRRWKAEEVGFLGDRDQDTADLFRGGPK